MGDDFVAADHGLGPVAVESVGGVLYVCLADDPPPIADFQRAWNGIYFVITEDQAVAKSHFNRASQWQAFARAPLSGRFADPVSQQALSLTAPFYRDIS